MKYCGNCGNEMRDDENFCSKCGAQVNGNSIQGGQQYSSNNSSTGTNGMAIAGFILSFFVPLLGWIFGGVGLNKSKKMNGKGKGLAIAAIVIATIMFILNLYLIRSGNLQY